MKSFNIKFQADSKITKWQAATGHQSHTVTKSYQFFRIPVPCLFEIDKRGKSIFGMFL